MFERFTDPARQVVTAAEQEARALGHGWIGTEHLLLGLLQPGSGLAGDVLAGAGVDHATVRAAVLAHLPARAGGFSEQDAEALRALGIDVHEVLRRLADSVGHNENDVPGSGTPKGRLRFTRRAKKVLELSLREAVWLRSGSIGTEHLLLGLVREGDGLGVQVLRELGVDPETLRVATLRAITEAA